MNRWTDERCGLRAPGPKPAGTQDETARILSNAAQARLNFTRGRERSAHNNS